MCVMRLEDLRDMAKLIQRTLDLVDPRLVEHGKRVALLVTGLARAHGGYTERQIQDFGMVALLHDVGAYKTEEISSMLRFETEDVWDHSIYGYLFIRDLSPLSEYAQAILFHHLRYDWLRTMDTAHVFLTEILSLADRVDVFLENVGLDKKRLAEYLGQKRGTQFSPEAIDLLWRAEASSGILEGQYAPDDFPAFAGDTVLAPDEVVGYLEMLIYAIDFRSQHTVTHTITTTQISLQLSRIMGFDGQGQEKVFLGALLHDIGKIGIPVEILEFAGKLSPQAMAVMRTHVMITDEILGDCIDPAVKRIAVRHHEKLDGSGYPAGLCADDLSMAERIVAVADIVSALCGTRSYKEAYPKAKALSILKAQAAQGLLDPQVVTLLSDRFDGIMEAVSRKCVPVLEMYYRMHQEYAEIRACFTEDIRSRTLESVRF